MYDFKFQRYCFRQALLPGRLIFVRYDVCFDMIAYIECIMCRAVTKHLINMANMGNGCLLIRNPSILSLVKSTSRRPLKCTEMCHFHLVFYLRQYLWTCDKIFVLDFLIFLWETGIRTERKSDANGLYHVDFYSPKVKPVLRIA